jgi:sodium transport system permease protein
VFGKWGAVAALSMLIALLSTLSFIPGQWLLRSDTLAALFRYGWPEVFAFLLLLLPLAGAVAALLMAVAIRSRTTKEAQASAALVVLAASVLPMVSLLNQEGEKPWQLWVPALAQFTLMTRVLKGETIGAPDFVGPALVAGGFTLLCLAYVARHFSTVSRR